METEHPLGVDGFAAELTRIIVDDAKSGTHKLVLLLALCDVLEGRTSATEVTFDELGDAAVALLWRQVREFTPAGTADAVGLAQARFNGKLATGSLGALAEPVAELRASADERELRALSSVRRELPGTYSAARAKVVSGLKKNPIERLQGHAAGRPLELLFRWVTAGPRPQSLVLVPGAADLLTRFLPLVRPLIRMEFLRVVADVNRIPMTNVALEEHLFGRERSTFPSPLRKALSELQGGRCFYLRDEVLGPRWEVDHFIPWAFIPNDAVENLVGARREVNNAKRETLPSNDHLRRWLASLEDRTEAGGELARGGTAVTSDLRRSLGVARSAYGLARPGMTVIEGVVDGRAVYRARERGDYDEALALIDTELERQSRGRTIRLASEAPPRSGYDSARR